MLAGQCAKAVAHECDVSESTKNWLCQFLRQWSSCLSGYSTPFIISRI